MKTWDAIIVGGGLIGMSLALSLRRHGAQVLVVERREPGREASHAAAGMLADLDPDTPEVLRPLAVASARLYPEFVHELQDESGTNVDLRDHGTLFFPDPNAHLGALATSMTDGAKLKELEPCLNYVGVAVLLNERSVDPRALMTAALKAGKHRAIEVASGSAVNELIVDRETVCGVRTAKTEFRAPDVYLVPRTDGRVLVGSTLEHAGFDKRVDADTVQRLHQAAAVLVPDLGQARMLEAWAGLRPGTPDGLPILGRGQYDGYFVATGHYRNGILLAPITALLMTQLIRGQQPELDLGVFAPGRFK